MIKNFPTTIWLCAGALVTMATTTLAETSSNAPPIRITSKIIQEASAATSHPVSPVGSILSIDNPPQHDLFRDSPKNLENIPNSCSHNSSSLCFDYRTGRAVYKPMRKLLPSIPGMTPQNLSIRRDKIVAQYTFK